MPRKSKALRLSQATELFAGYSGAGMQSTYQARFIADMISRLENDRGLSKKQREWLDSLIEEGVPVPKGDPTLLAKIDSAMATWVNNVDRNWEIGVIADFKTRIVQGRELSEKQTALLEKLFQRAEDDDSGKNIFNPSEEQVEDLKNLVKIYKGYAPQWQAERPAVRKALERVQSFIAGEGTIELYHYDKLNKAMGSKLRKLKNPRFNSGSIGWITLYEEGQSMQRRKWDDAGVRSLATAISNAYVNISGMIVNDWMLCTGEVYAIESGRVGKRK